MEESGRGRLKPCRSRPVGKNAPDEAARRSRTGLQGTLDGVLRHASAEEKLR